MSQKQSDNFLVNAAKLLDDKMGVGSGPAWRPYNNVTEFTSRFSALGRTENQMFWVRSPDNSNNADLYALRADKTPYKVLNDVDLSNYYTKGEIDTSLSTLQSLIDNHIADTGNPHDVTKAQVGLGNADNTSDLNKPISTAIQTAITNEASARSSQDIVLEGLIDDEQDRAQAIEAEIITDLAGKADLSGITGMQIITITDLDVDHKTYSNANLSSKDVNVNYVLYLSSVNRFLGSDEVTNIPSGGFILTYELDADAKLYLLGTLYTFATNTIQQWSANAFNTNAQVYWLGRLWRATQSTISTDIPGTSTKFVEILSEYSPYYAPKKNLFNKNDLVDGTLNTSGLVSGLTGKTTKKFAVPPNTDIYVHGFGTGMLSGEHRYATYDVNGNMVAVASLIINGTRTTKITTGASVRQLAVTVNRTEDDAGQYDLLQIERWFITDFEAWQLNAVGVGSYPIRNADLDLLSKKDTIELIPVVGLSNVYDSKNMADPADFVSGQYFNVGDGYTVQADARYFTGGFVLVEPGVAYSAAGTRGTRFVYFYRADKTWISSLNGERLSFTTPTGVDVAYVRFTGYIADLAQFQFEVGAAPSSYVPYAGLTPFASSINDQNIIASALRAGATINGNQIATIEDLDNFASLAPFGDYVTVLKDANFYYIRAYFNETYDIVQKITFETINNRSFDFQNEQLILKSAADTISGYAGTLLHTNGDDTAPIRTDNEGHIGEGHGFQQPRVTLTAHGKTSADLLSKWTDGSHNFFLVEIPDANNLMFYSEAYVSAGHYVTEKSFASGTLTHVSGATNTTSISTAVTTIDQKYPVTQDLNNRVYVDGKEIIDDGIYKGKKAKFVCEYDIVDCCFLTLQTPFQWNAGPSAMRFSIAYTYNLNGSCVTHHQINFKRDKPVEYWYVNQATPISAPTYPRRFGYLPKTLPIDGVDYNAIVETTVEKPIALFTPTYFIDPNLPPDRHIQFHADSGGVKKIGFAMGFNTEYGEAKNSLRKLLTNAWALSPKSYPRAIYSYPAVNQVIHVVGYRVWFDATIGAAACVYAYELNGVNYLFIDYKSTVVKENVKVDPNFTNKSIEIVETYGDITLHSIDVVPATGLLISSTGGNLLLKIK